MGSRIQVISAPTESNTAAVPKLRCSTRPLTVPATTSTLSWTTKARSNGSGARAPPVVLDLEVSLVSIAAGR